MFHVWVEINTRLTNQQGTRHTISDGTTEICFVTVNMTSRLGAV